jgi:hypothetical protein
MDKKIVYPEFVEESKPYFHIDILSQVGTSC